MDLALRIFLGAVIVGWLVKLGWERSFQKRTGRPKADLWRTPTKIEASNLQKTPPESDKVFPAAPPKDWVPPTAKEHRAAMSRIARDN